eukprot:CAMPEP_0175097200 /NCGR_PEP_ID=MMETSP0086_2-20121207/5156_1 /TAXON_ID=136419 /ORGANISM="Unknown Unknown, Strain D1" /LENGTH=526 /DNA_ID=CAMNT_0016370687 /DNA_START=26 /DNA_END=1607 /DNA_ORIENTATION=-
MDVYERKPVVIPKDPSALMHRQGVFNRPSNNPMNHYSTSYSCTHDFRHSDKSDTELRRPTLSTGFSHNNTNTTIATGSMGGNRRLGQALSSDERVKSVAATTSTYTRFYDEQLQNNKTVDPLEKKATIPSTCGVSGYSRNLKKKLPWLQPQPQKKLPLERHPESRHTSYALTYRKPGGDPQYLPPNTLPYKCGNGFTRNISSAGSFKLSPMESKQWMQTTYNNVHREKKPQTVVPKARNKSERLVGTNVSPYTTIVQEPPAAGTGTEQSKLNGPLLPDREGYTGRSYEDRSHTKFDAQHAIKLLDETRIKDPLEYQYYLDGEKLHQTTYQLAHQSPRAQTQRSIYGEKVRSGAAGFSASNPSTARSNVQLGFQRGHNAPMSGPYSTTSHTFAEHAAAHATYLATEPPTITPGWQGSGYTQNFKAGSNNAASKVRPEAVGSEQRPHVLSSQAYGDSSALPGVQGPFTQNVVKTNHIGAFSRDHVPTSIDETHIPNGLNRYVHPTVSRIQATRDQLTDKNYGGEPSRF